MKYSLDNLTKIEYDACINALDNVHDEADNEYTGLLEDTLAQLDMCEYLNTKDKIALLKEIIGVLQDRGEED